MGGTSNTYKNNQMLYNRLGKRCVWRGDYFSDVFDVPPTLKVAVYQQLITYFKGITRSQNHPVLVLRP